MKSKSPALPAGTAAPQADPTQATPVYARIAALLRKALTQGSIPTGAVLLEGPLADLLGVTRTPVRHALRELEEEGRVARFEGRGVLAGSADAEPLRVELTAAMLGVDGGQESVRKLPGWQAIYDEVEHDVVHLSIFGQVRLNEIELARHFGVGRTVAHEVLLRLKALGLVEKDERQRWNVAPLDRKRIGDLYELRGLLEPPALAAAVRVAPASDIQLMVKRLRRALQAYPNVTRADMDQLENDLHVRLLSHCPNPSILQSLQRTHCILTLSKHFLGEAAPMPLAEPFMNEHLSVLEAVLAHDVAQAQSLMHEHLERSCEKVTERVAFVHDHIAEPKVPYILT